MSQQAHAVRGKLPPESLGARGIERYGRNPGCARLALMTAAQVLPETILTAVYGRPSSKQPAPFAIILGNQFERHLLERGAARLLDLYVREGRLRSADRRVVDVEALAPGTKPADLAARVRATRAILERKLRGDPSAPHLVLKPRLELQVPGGKATIEPDFLVAAPGDAEGGAPGDQGGAFYRLGEIKIYADRDGKTDAADLRGACRQAAVGLVALRRAVQDLGSPLEVPAACDLVLRRPRSLYATLRPITIAGEVATLEGALSGLPAAAQAARAHLAGRVSDASAFSAVPFRYDEGCMEFCALQPVCKEQALGYGDPAALGGAARETLAGTDLWRALDLLGGAQPATPEEASLQARLEGVDRLYEEALAHV